MKKYISIRTDTELHDKFCFASKYNGRSATGQVIYLMRTFVEEYERDHGEISENDLRGTGIIK